VKTLLIFLMMIPYIFPWSIEGNVEKDASGDSFYDLARLFMLKQEKELYKRLIEKGDKQEFIKGFWSRRDPNPNTTENEFLIEIQKRINYANTWFWLSKSSRNLGWDTDRGRIFLVLGPADRVVFYSGIGSASTQWEGQRNRTSKQYQNEAWTYYRYRLPVYFKKSGLNDYHLKYADQILVDALEDMKLFYVSGNTESLPGQHKLNFKVNEDQIILEIPIKFVAFIERDQQMAAKFLITIKFYSKNKKVHQLKEEKIVHENPEILLKLQTIRIALPLVKELNGNHLVFVEVKDLQSNQTILNQKKIKF